MITLELKPTHKIVKDYYQHIFELQNSGRTKEGSVSPAFANVLRYCAGQVKLRFIEQESIPRGEKRIQVDGILLDDDDLRYGIWEAKDIQDDIDKEINAKFEKNYPRDNILFQSPNVLVLYRGGEKPIFYESIQNSPENLVTGLKLFFNYRKPEVAEWKEVSANFQGQIAELGQKLVEVIENEYKTNRQFHQTFDDFTELCRSTINPNLAISAIQEMLVQHLLTERVFRTVFNNPDFVDKNIIALEIEKVIRALTAQSFSRAEFIKNNQLDRFYVALEQAAGTIEDFAEKQPFLNTVYEKFFQGFAVKVADTHGIVYTPQPIVEFMVKSVEEILQREFKRSLADKGVHILDPFVGTGNFIIRILREINALNPFHLEAKYLTELHCNEVLLLPYYIASMNIEHEFYELSGRYKPFTGICLADTFELTEGHQRELFVPENMARVLQQKEAPIFVIIGNPPYNVGQVNENDNNKNRKYPKLDNLVKDGYAKDSKATNKNALSDVYVKAFQWATWRLKDKTEGIVAFVTNNSFLESIAFDGMREHLARDFDKMFIVDLGGNVRKNPKLSGTKHNVFGIQVGVSVIFLIKGGLCAVERESG